MTLSPYHQKYASRSDEEMRRRADVKQEELRKILEQVSFTPESDPVRVAVMGCGEVRLVAHHKRMLEELLGRAVELTTFDISIEHLEGLENIVQHDVTELLPNGPYDVTYAHVLLKFIGTEKQWNVVKNSYDALRDGGIAIHVFDREEIDTREEILSDGMNAVPLERWKRQLDDEGIRYKFIEWTIEGILPEPLPGAALVLLK